MIFFLELVHFSNHFVLLLDKRLVLSSASLVLLSIIFKVLLDLPKFQLFVGQLILDSLNVLGRLLVFLTLFFNQSFEMSVLLHFLFDESLFLLELGVQAINFLLEFTFNNLEVFLLGLQLLKLLLKLLLVF